MNMGSGVSRMSRGCKTNGVTVLSRHEELAAPQTQSELHFTHLEAAPSLNNLFGVHNMLPIQTGCGLHVYQ